MVLKEARSGSRRMLALWRFIKPGILAVSPPARTIADLSGNEET